LCGSASLAQAGPLPAQLIAIIRHDSQAHVLDLRPVQTVAARTVGEVLLELA